MANNNKSPFRHFVNNLLKILYGIVDVLFHWLFSLVYGKNGKTMPAVSDLLLLESATSIAYKIRNGKVTYSFITFVISKFKLIRFPHS